MKSKIKTAFNFLLNNSYLLFLIVPTIIPFFALSFYNHPTADDFCLSDSAKDMGVFPAQVHWYTTWTGRFFSTLLITTSPMFFDSILMYKLFAFVLITLFIIAVYLIVHELFGKTISKMQKITAALIMFWVYVYSLPTLVEGIYWLSGSYTYFVSIIMSLFVVYFLLRALRTEKLFKLNYGIAAVLLFLLIACNETTMVAWDAILLLLLGWDTIKNRRVNKYFLGLFIISIVSSVIVYFAPGNAIRSAAVNSARAEILVAVKMAIKALIPAFREWITPSMLIVFALLVYPLYKFATSGAELAKKIYVNPLITAGTAVAAITGAFFAAFWTVAYTPLRSVNVSYFVFILFAVWTIYNCVYLIAQRNVEIKPLPFYIHAVFFAILVLMLASSRNILTPYQSLKSGIAQAYDQELMQRYELIRACQQNKDEICVVPERVNHAPGLAFHDIENDETDWKNGCIADFYEIKGIKTEAR